MNKTRKTTFQGVPAYRQWDGYLTISRESARKLCGKAPRPGYERRTLSGGAWVGWTTYHGKPCLYIREEN